MILDRASETRLARRMGIDDAKTDIQFVHFKAFLDIHEELSLVSV